MAGRGCAGRTTAFLIRSSILASTTKDPAAQVSQAVAVPVEGGRAGTRAAGQVLMTLVFVGGATVMTVEMCASRLLAPYFGTSRFIRGILIGVVMIYLAVGYALGGRLADRDPSAPVLSGILGLFSAGTSVARGRASLLFGGLLAVVLALALFARGGLIKPPAMGELVYEKESAYNYIQVVRTDKQVSLMLNEGHAIHSIYNP